MEIFIFIAFDNIFKQNTVILNDTVFTIFCSNKCSLGEHKSSFRNKQKNRPAVPGFLVLVYMLSTTLMYAAKLCLMIVMNSSCMPLFSCPQLPLLVSYCGLYMDTFLPVWALWCCNFAHSKKDFNTNADADLFVLLAGSDKRQSLQIKGKYSTVFFTVVNVGKARMSLAGLQTLQTLLCSLSSLQVGGTLFCNQIVINLSAS